MHELSSIYFVNDLPFRILRSYRPELADAMLDALTYGQLGTRCPLANTGRKGLYQARFQSF